MNDDEEWLPISEYDPDPLPEDDDFWELKGETDEAHND